MEPEFKFIKTSTGDYAVYGDNQLLQCLLDPDDHTPHPPLICTVWGEGGSWGIVETTQSTSRFRNRKKAAQHYLVEILLKPLTNQWKEDLRQRGVPQIRPTSRQMSTEKAQRIYELLINLCGAPDGETHLNSFVFHQTQEHPPTEWRFGGFLGFGGKFYNSHGGFRVSCYSEDTNPITEHIMARANLALDGIYRECFDSSEQVK